MGDGRWEMGGEIGDGGRKWELSTAAGDGEMDGQLVNTSTPPSTYPVHTSHSPSNIKNPNSYFDSKIPVAAANALEPRTRGQKNAGGGPKHEQ